VLRAKDVERGVKLMAVALAQYSLNCKVKKKKVAIGFVLIGHFEDHKAHSPFNSLLKRRSINAPP
jgi:hypothetical protein